MTLRPKLACRVALTVTVTGCLLGISCSGGDDPSSRSCVEVFEDGATTPNLTKLTSCEDADGASRQTNPHSWRCEDGSQLYANAFGYGVEGEEWHTDQPLRSDDATPPTRGPMREAIQACDRGSS